MKPIHNVLLKPKPRPSPRIVKSTGGPAQSITVFGGSQISVSASQRKQSAFRQHSFQSQKFPIKTLKYPRAPFKFPTRTTEPKWLETMESALPPASDLSPSIVSFLNDKFRTNANLNGAPALLSELQTQCGDLDRTLIDLNRSLGSSLLAYASFSDRVHGVLGDINAQLTGLGSSTRSRSSGFVCAAIEKCAILI